MTSNFLSIFLQAAAPAGGGGFGGFGGLLLPIGMIAVMYFFMIRPQQKRAKEQKMFSANIAAGEQIITSSGIHGRISRVNDDGTLQVEIARNVYIIIERSAVSMEMTAAFRKKSDLSVVSTSTTA
jgi:preprotein translocase subunit YajC